jgi:hypothetical protein
VDGLLYFYESKDERRKIIVQGKGGGVKRGDVATLLGDVNNQKAAGGILLTLEELTRPMRDEAAVPVRFAACAGGRAGVEQGRRKTNQRLLMSTPILDPSLPADHSPLDAREMRGQFTRLVEG